ncbi:MAG: RNA polymerase sigma-70 factor [Bacteroides sp.]
MNEASDLAAFNKLFFDYKEKFIRFAQSYVHNIALAEDYAIDSLLYYWENRQNLENDSNIPAYIFTVIKHKCLNYLQHLQLENEVADKMVAHAQWELNTRISSLQACEPEELFTAEMQELVNEILENLPERTRLIFIMSRMKNMSHKEIAAELKISTKGVEFHINKALKEFRVGLKDYFPILCFFLLN